MRLLSRHIFRTLLPPFLWGVVALTGMMLLNGLAPLIDLFGGKGLSFAVMAKGIMLTLPALMVLTIPMSVLVATLYAYSQLAGDLEMVAMYASGVSVWRMLRPALIGAAFAATANYVLYDQLVPFSNGELKALKSDVSNKTPQVAMRPQVLNRFPNTGYALRADEITANGDLTNVTIYDLNFFDRPRWIRAATGHMGGAPNGRDLVLTLRHGEILEIKQGEKDRLQRTSFRTDNIQIRDVTNLLQRNADPNERDERSLSGCQLLARIDSSRQQASIDQRSQEWLTRRDLRHLIGLPPLPPPATRPVTASQACSSRNRITARIKRVILPRTAAAQEIPARTSPQDPPAPSSVTPAAANPAPPPFTPPPLAQVVDQATAVAPQQLQNGLLSNYGDVQGTRLGRAGSVEWTRRYTVEFHKKFAIPLACFCFVLLGMSLALKYPRSGIGLVIGASLVIFLGFYIMLIGGEGLAKKGFLPPVVAIYGPVAAFTFIGLLAVGAANREMGTARTGGLGDIFGKLFRWRRR